MSEARKSEGGKAPAVNRTATVATPPTVVAPPTAAPSQPPPAAPPVLTRPLSMPGGSTNHKESVFIKLNNRIRTLEMNISLSSQYLSELSRQYVSQMDEIRRQYERTSKTANDTNRAAEDTKRELTARIDKLQAAIDALDAKIANIIPPAALDDLDDNDGPVDDVEVGAMLPAPILDDGKRWTVRKLFF